MRSGELARLAGVSVRTLRHYHAIGLLPEPARHENGYREYGAADLLRVLRIRQLAALGFSLEQIDPMLGELDGGAPDRRPSHADALLGELDAQLARQIAELEEKRAQIARLRSADIAPDVPERASAALDAMRELSSLASHGNGFLDLAPKDSDRLAMGIATRLYSDGELGEMERVLRAVAGRGLVDEYVRVSGLLEGLAPAAGAEERDRAVEAAMGFLGKLVDCFSPENWLRPDTQLDSVLGEVAGTGYNAAQRDVSERIFDALAERIRELHRGDSEEGCPAAAAPVDPDAAS